MEYVINYVIGSVLSHVFGYVLGSCFEVIMCKYCPFQIVKYSNHCNKQVISNDDTM